MKSTDEREKELKKLNYQTKFSLYLFIASLLIVGVIKVIRLFFFE